MRPEASAGQPAVASFETLAVDIELDMGFDINAAFQSALSEVASDEATALEEKVSRMEFIVEQGTSAIYRDFVDFRGMAAQMELMCAHDHALNDAVQSSGVLGGFMDSQRLDDGHGHAAGHDDGHDNGHGRTSGRRGSHHRTSHGGGPDSSQKKKEKSKKKSSWQEWYAALRKSRLIRQSFKAN